MGIHRSAWIELGSPPRVSESPVALHVKLGASGSERGSRSRRLWHLREALEDARLYREDLGAFQRRALRELAPDLLETRYLPPALRARLGPDDPG